MNTTEHKTHKNSFYTNDMKDKFEELVKKDSDFVFHIDNFWKIREGLFSIMQKDKKNYHNILPMCKSIDGIIEVMCETGKGQYYPNKKEWYK